MQFKNKTIAVNRQALKLLIYLVLLFIIPPPILAQNVKGKSNCMVSEFKMLAYTNHNPTIREEFAKKWLLVKGLSCNQTQLKIIQLSAPAWLGTALSTEVSIIIDDLHESKFAGDANKLLEHYTPAMKNYAPTVDTFTNPQARAPIVSPQAGGGIMGGVIALNKSPGNGEEEDKRKKTYRVFHLNPEV